MFNQWKRIEQLESDKVKDKWKNLCPLMKSFHIKEVIADKVKNKTNDWFAKVPSHDKTNVARRTL